MFQRIDDMWEEALTALTNTGDSHMSRNGGTHELLGYQAVLQDPQRTWLTNSQRALSPIYAASELLWYLSGEQNIERVFAYAPRYCDFAENGIAHGAYGFRMTSSPGWPMEISQLDAVIALLREKPGTRQAVLSLWHCSDLYHAILGDHKDLPCTLALQFILRGGFLHCVATMRSNDMWLGFPYDIFAFTTLQRLVAWEVNVRVGCYTHQVGSVHAYACNLDRIYEALKHPGVLAPDAHHWQRPAVFDLNTQIQHALMLERVAREMRLPPNVEELCPIFADLVLCAAAKWVPVDCEGVQSPALRKALYADTRRYGWSGKDDAVQETLG